MIRSLANKIESTSEAPDISGVMDSVNDLLDRSVGAEEYVIRSGGDATALVDLNELDFEQLALRFAANKRTAAQQLQRDLEGRLDQAVRKNPTRVELAERFRRLIDEYNAGTHNLEEFLRRLKAVNDDLNDDEQRTVRESLSEAELAVYDLLTKPEPELTGAEQVQVKAAAKQLLERVTDKLVLDWRKHQQTRAAVRVAVRDVLDAELPADPYPPEVYDEKVQRVFDHLYASYFHDYDSVYGGDAPAGSVPATPTISVAALVAAPESAAHVNDEVVEMIKSDPDLFAKVMERVFGLDQTWTRPTERLLDGESKHVEYKASARWSMSSPDPRVPKRRAEQIIAKTVAGFLNAQGGTLLIGVNDDGRPVGLDADYGRVTPPNADGFVNWLDTMLDGALGHAGSHRVQTRIDEVSGVEVCRLDIPASSRPIWTKFAKQKAVLFERRNNSTRQVPPDEVDAFLAERFGDRA